MQFIDRLERGATVFDERNQIRFDRFIEERLGLTRTPGALDHRFQTPLGKEIDPFAVRAPGRAVAVDAIAGQGGRDTIAEPEQPDLAVEILHRRHISQPLTVRRPAQISKAVHAGDRDSLALLFLDVKEPELLVLVLVGDPFAVRRRNAVETKNLPVVRQAFRVPHPVGREPFELQFPGLVRQREQRFAVGEETGVAIPDAQLAGCVHKTALADRSDKHLAARGQHQSIRVR